MDRKKVIAVVILVVGGVLTMWARYASEQAEKRKREALFRELSTYTTERRAESAPASDAQPAPEPKETREMFASALPLESFGLIKQAVGGEFKLMELHFGETLVTAKISTDGETIKHYLLDKDTKKVKGPGEVNVIGDGKLSDSLFDPKVADFSLIPKLAKEALERAALPEGKAESVSIAYAFIREEGEKPQWTVLVGSGTGEAWQHKIVVFDEKGKFKNMF